METKLTSARVFLFLQGPPGPLFRLLGEAMIAKGITVYRINLSGGDWRDWSTDATDFTAPFSEWPVFVDRFLIEHSITDLLLFGDCRPYHVAAHGIAGARAVRIHVLEEGYLRPDWMTLEPDGVNARSTLSRDKAWFLEMAQTLPAEPVSEPITATFRRRARDSFGYYKDVLLGWPRYRHYRSHRSSPLLVEFAGWIWKFLWERHRQSDAQRTLRQLGGEPFYIFPLQLSGDYQIKAHSCFPDMRSAARYVMESFAAHAPPHVHLLLKTHPLDNVFVNWAYFARREARRMRIDGRLHCVNVGDLNDMARKAQGMACVNSTSATIALAHGIPVCALGEAIYNIPGLTHQGHLDFFWSEPSAPEPGVFDAFRRVLVNRCLVRGGLASESAVSILINSVLERLAV